MEPDTYSGSCGGGRYYLDVCISSGGMDPTKIWSASSDGHVSIPAWRSNSLSAMDYQPDYFLPVVWHWQTHIPSSTTDQCINCSRTMVCSITWQVILCLGCNAFNGHGPISAICTAIHERK